MLMKVINTKISLRRDTLSNWLSLSGTILQSGEVAIVTNTDGNENLKIGNGISSFGQLPYLYENKFETNEVTTKSISQGLNAKASSTSLATGIYTEANGSFNVVHGIEAQSLDADNYTFVFNGVNLPSIADRYTSHGEGTFNVNSKNGLDGFYIGEKTLSAYLSNYASIQQGTYNDDLSVLSILSIVKINSEDYHNLVIQDQVDPNTLYIISGDYLNMYGQQIKNLAEPVDVTDATTKQYVDDYIDVISTELNASINNNTTTLNTSISNLSVKLSTNLSTTQSNLSTLSTSVNTLSTTVKTLSTNTSTISTNVSTISSNVSTVSSNLNTLSTDHTALKTNVNTISTDLTDKINKKLIVDGVETETLSITHYSQDDFYTKVVNDDINENELYIISSDYTNLYNKQIKNLAEPTDTTDAVTKNYVDILSADMQAKIDNLQSLVDTLSASISSLLSTSS